MATNESNTQVFEQVEAMLAGEQPNEQGVLQKAFPIDDARYTELLIERPAEARYNQHAGSGQIAFKRRDNETVEHYYFSEREDGLVAAKSIETDWDEGADEYGADEGSELTEVVQAETEASNIIGEGSNELQPADEDDMQTILGLLQKAEADFKH